MRLQFYLIIKLNLLMTAKLLLEINYLDDFRKIVYVQKQFDIVLLDIVLLIKNCIII